MYVAQSRRPLSVGFPSLRLGFAVVDRLSRPSKTPAPLKSARSPPPLKVTATLGKLDEDGEGIPGMFILFNHFVNEAIEAAFLLLMYALSSAEIPALYN
jgi:hypothetical protein